MNEDTLKMIGAVLLCVLAAALVLCMPAFVVWTCLWAWNQFPHAPSEPWDVDWTLVLIGVGIFALLWHAIDAFRPRRD